MNRKYSISLLSVAVLASFALFVACSNSDGPTSAGMDFQPAMSDMPAPSGNLSTGNGAGLNPALWEGTLTEEGDFVRGIATNPAKGPRYMGLICFQGQNFDIDSQTQGTDNHLKVSLVPAGADFNHRVAKQCGNNQCDLFFDLTYDEVKAMVGADFGKKLIKGASFYHKCEPRAPEGCEEGTLEWEETGECLPICVEETDETVGLAGLNQTPAETKPDQKPQDPECLCPDGSVPDPKWGCREPTCEDLNPAYFHGFTFTAKVNEEKTCHYVGLCGKNGKNCKIKGNRCVGKYTGKDWGAVKIKYSRENPISGSIHAHNNADWRLELRAKKPGEDYHKAKDEATLECDESEGLKVSYPWAGHGARYWYFEVYKNGNKVWTSSTIDGH